MSKRTIVWILVALAVIAACVELQSLRRADAVADGRVTYKSKSGDLVQFMLDALSKYGRTVTVTNSFPAMRAEWRYAEDPKGFQILLPQRYREELVRCLTQALGEPMRQNQYPQLFYKEDKFGVFVAADLEGDPIHIICVRKGAL
jgi:hypothetical protein